MLRLPNSTSLCLLALAMIIAVSGTGCSTPAATPTQTTTAPATPAQATIAPATPTQTVAVSEGLKEVNGTQLYYKSIGQGPPIFVLHGGPGRSHRYFLPYMEGLADDHQLIFYDQRGTGSSHGDLDLKATSIDQFVEDLEALRVAFGFEKVALIGHSWGAIIALSYALKYPAQIDRLVLIAPRPVTNNFVIEQATTLSQRTQSLSPEDQQALNTICRGPSAQQSAAELAECNRIAATLDFYDPAKSLAVDWTTEENTEKNGSLVRSLITTNFNRLQQDFAAALADVRMPTLVIHGAFDPIPEGSSRYIHAQIVDSQLAVFAESGHFPFIEQPELFITTVRTFMGG
jgi:proline iminopeptidase